MILDSRGANLLERLPKRWIRILASADALLRVVLDEEVHLEGRRLLAFLSTTLSLSANGDHAEQDGASPAAVVADKMQDTYKAVELLPNERKAFRDQEVASFLGLRPGWQSWTFARVFEESCSLGGSAT